MKVNRTASWMIIATLIIILLIYGQPIIVPFVIALLIWFIVKKTRNLIDKIHFIKKYIPRWIKSILASLVIFWLLVIISKILIQNIESLALSYEQYVSNIELIGQKINVLFNIDIQEEMTSFVQGFDFSSYLRSLLNSLSEILGSMVMTIFYVVFIFIEESLFENKLKLMFKEKEQYIKYAEMFTKVDKSMSGYISLKSLTSSIVSLASYFILLAVGIDSPLFWSFLIFVLNFIPSVGPIIGTILPALFSLIQFGEFAPFLIILFGAGGVAMLVGSLVEPRLMGNTLNISPLVAVLSLALWGSIWGIIGMFLSVPITVALIIIFAQFPASRSIAILLSEKGKI